MIHHFKGLVQNKYGGHLKGWSREFLKNIFSKRKLNAYFLGYFKCHDKKKIRNDCKCVNNIFKRDILSLVIFCISIKKKVMKPW